MNILLQVLDDGKITDAQGREINFANTIIIMTTNAGSEKSNSVSGFSMDSNVQTKDRVDKALSKFLRPEFINRIDEIITFRHLSVSDFEKIANIMLTKLSDHLLEKDIKLSYNNEVLEFIAKESYSEKYGARNMRRYIERNVEDLIANAIIDSFPSKLYGIALVVEDASIQLKSI